MNPRNGKFSHWINFFLCLAIFSGLLEFIPLEASQKGFFPKNHGPLDKAICEYEEGYQFYKSGDFSNAQKHFSEAISLEPNYIKAHYWLGKLYREMGMLKEAIFHWEEALRIKDLIKARRLALTTENNEYPALSQILSALQRKKNAQLAFQKGKALLEQGHWEGAVSEAKTAVELFPGNTEFQKFLARILWDKEDFEGSSKAYLELLNNDVPKELILEACKRLEQVGKVTIAAKAARNHLKKFPVDPQILSFIARNEEKTSFETVSAGRVVKKLRGQTILDFGLDSGIKLADEYTLRLRTFRQGEPVMDAQNRKIIARTPEISTGELLVTKVFSNSSWALIRNEFGQGIKEGDLVEIQTSTW